MSQGPSEETFNECGELRVLIQKDIHYFDSFENDSYEDVDNLIDICVDFHDNTPNNNYVDKIITLSTHFLCF